MPEHRAQAWAPSLNRVLLFLFNLIRLCELTERYCDLSFSFSRQDLHLMALLIIADDITKVSFGFFFFSLCSAFSAYKLQLCWSNMRNVALLGSVQHIFSFYAFVCKFFLRSLTMLTLYKLMEIPCINKVIVSYDITVFSKKKM